MEAAAPDLEVADEAVGAATVWINSWLVETAGRAGATTAIAERQSWSRVGQVDGRAAKAYLERVQTGHGCSGVTTRGHAGGDKGRSEELSCGSRVFRANHFY